MEIRECRIGTIACPLRNITNVSTSTAEATTFLSVWKMEIMGLFSFGLDVSLVGRKLLREKCPAT